MGDIRNKIAKIERAVRERAAMDQLSRLLDAGYNPLLERQSISREMPSATLHSMAGAPSCRCGAYAVRIYREMPMCDACEDAAMNLEALHRAAWSHDSSRKRRR